MLARRRKIKAAPNLSAARSRRPIGSSVDGPATESKEASSNDTLTKHLSHNNNSEQVENPSSPLKSPSSPLKCPASSYDKSSDVSNRTLGEHEIVTRSTTSGAVTSPEKEPARTSILSTRSRAPLDKVDQGLSIETTVSSAASEGLTSTSVNGSMLSRLSSVKDVNDKADRVAASPTVRKSLTRLGGSIKSFGLSFGHGNRPASLPLRSRSRPAPNIPPRKNSVTSEVKQRLPASEEATNHVRTNPAVNGADSKESEGSSDHQQQAKEMTQDPVERKPDQDAMADLENVEFVLADDVDGEGIDNKICMDLEEGTFTVPVIEGDASIAMNASPSESSQQSRTASPPASPTQTTTADLIATWSSGLSEAAVNDACPNVEASPTVNIPLANDSPSNCSSQSQPVEENSRESTGSRIAFNRRSLTRFGKTSTPIGLGLTGRRTNGPSVSLPARGRAKPTPKIPPRRPAAVATCASEKKSRRRTASDGGSTTEEEEKNVCRINKIVGNLYTADMTDESSADDPDEVDSPGPATSSTTPQRLDPIQAKKDVAPASKADAPSPPIAVNAIGLPIKAKESQTLADDDRSACTADKAGSASQKPNDGGEPSKISEEIPSSATDHPPSSDQRQAPGKGSAAGSLTRSLVTRTGITAVAPGARGGIRRSFGLRNRFKPNLNADRRGQAAENALRTRKISTGSINEDLNINTGSVASPTAILSPVAANKRRRLRSTSASAQSSDDENNSQRTEDQTSQNAIGSKVTKASSADTRPDTRSESTPAGRERHVSGTLQDRSGAVGPLTPTTPTRRTRRLTENRVNSECYHSQLSRRREEHKRRFLRGVPERGEMTMFDLIYYNPENDTKLDAEEDTASVISSLASRANSEADPASRRNSGAIETLESNGGEHFRGGNKVGGFDAAGGMELNNDDYDEEDSLPVPQVKVGPNGEIVLDESSTIVETTAAKRAKVDLSRATVVVESNMGTTNYGTWSKKRRKGKDFWSERETVKFYKALSMVGSDFSMMETLFKNRTRQELKLKFKKEEKCNGALIDKCLRQQGQYADLQEFMDEESEEEEEEVERRKKDHSRAKKTGRTRRKYPYRNMGYYDSSSGGEDADTTRLSPARKRSRTSSAAGALLPSNVRNTLDSIQSVADSRAREVQRRSTLGGPLPSAGSSSGERAKRGTNSLRTPPTANMPSDKSPVATPGSSSASPSLRRSAVELSTLQKFPGVQFPAALLAANPGLVGAKPGSLVVVASPSKTDPSAQLLHVYMVSDKKKDNSAPDSLQGGVGTSSGRSTPLAYCSSPVGSGMTLEPGVDMTLDPAVVRAVDKNRQSLERQHQAGPKAGRLPRSRTYSEGILRRERTLSGSIFTGSSQRTRTLSGSAQELTQSLTDGIDAVSSTTTTVTPATIRPLAVKSKPPAE